MLRRRDKIIALVSNRGVCDSQQEPSDGSDPGCKKTDEEPMVWHDDTQRGPSGCQKNVDLIDSGCKKIDEELMSRHENPQPGPSGCQNRDYVLASDSEDFIEDSDLDKDYVMDSFSSSDSDHQQENKMKKKQKRNVIMAQNILESTHFFETIIETCIANAFDIIKDKFTKTGKIRKRKTCEDSIEERKLIAQNIKRDQHTVKDPCSLGCKKMCSLNMTHAQQMKINEKYWDLTPEEQKWFIFKRTSKKNTQRTTVGEGSKRKYTFKYTLPKTDVEEIEVCKVFFQATLGYSKVNDKVIRNVISKTDGKTIPPNKRGKSIPTNKLDKKVVMDHIESYKPCVSHYRREHAPLRRYLPSDIMVTDMHNNYLKENPENKVSYEYYRKTKGEMNISFANLGHEECWSCEKKELHVKETKHMNPTTETECEKCGEWVKHHELYTKARIEYEKDSIEEDKNHPRFSVDLQKVIMLPRCEMFKELVFTPRIIAFNESFVPLGENKTTYPIAVIWHEGIAGRKKEDIISTFYSFFLKMRDAENVTLWLDNCSAQNKNWAICCFFIYIVNCEEINLKNLHIKYFEPGHTFMSADSFHHQVESSLKKTKKVYDWEDYKECVSKANSNKVTVIQNKTENFYDWKDYTSQYKLNKIIPRPYINEMVYLKFTRGRLTIQYKNSFDQVDFIEENILINTMQKRGVIPKPPAKQQPRGISKPRKENLLKKLEEILPSNRLEFWKSLAITESELAMDD